LRRGAEVLLLVDQPVENLARSGRSDAMECDDLLQRVTVGVEADITKDGLKSVGRIDGVLPDGLAEASCAGGSLQGLSHRLQDDLSTSVGCGGVLIRSRPVCIPEALLEVRPNGTDRGL